jgi:hypothetical protein
MLHTSAYLGFGSIERSRDARHESLSTSAQGPMPNAQCPMPHAPCPYPIFQNLDLAAILISSTLPSSPISLAFC